MNGVSGQVVQPASRRLTPKEENRLNEAAKVRIANLLGVKRNMIDLTDDEPPRKVARCEEACRTGGTIERAQAVTRAQEGSTMKPPGPNHPDQGPLRNQIISPPFRAQSPLQNPTAAPHNGIPGSSSYQHRAQTQNRDPLVSQNTQPALPTELLSRISTSVASLGTSQLQDILSTAALRHPDVLQLVQASLGQRETNKSTTHQAALYGRLLAQSQEQIGVARSENKRIRTNSTIDQSGRLAGAPPQMVPAHTQQMYSPFAHHPVSQKYLPGYPMAYFQQQPYPPRMAYPRSILAAPQVVTVPQQEPPIDFSDKIYRVTNFLYNKWGGKEAHVDHTGDATEAIQAEIRKIARKVDRDSASSTKYSALETLAGIGCEVATADGGSLAVAVRDRMYDEDDFLVNSCWKVYNKMSRTEKLDVCHPKKLKESLQKLEDRRGGCFDGFGSFLKQFKKTSVPGPDNEENDEEEEGDEDEDDVFDDDSPEEISEEENYGPYSGEDVDEDEEDNDGSENS